VTAPAFDSRGCWIARLRGRRRRAVGRAENIAQKTRHAQMRARFDAPIAKTKKTPRPRQGAA